MARERPDVMILDLGLPDMDGTEVIRGVRGWASTPIIVLSVWGQESQKVAALDAGADDYVTKPFGMDELLARLRAAVRRASPAPDEPVVTTADFTVDLAAKRVTRADGSDVRLTPTEWQLLEILVRNRGRLVTQRQLLQEVWGPAYETESNYLRVYIAQLRRKLEPEPSRPRYLLTEPGMGYRFDPDRGVDGRARRGGPRVAGRRSPPPGQPMPKKPSTVVPSSSRLIAEMPATHTVATTLNTGLFAALPSTLRRLVRIRMKTRMTGVTMPCSTWVPISRVIRLMWVRASAAPMRTCTPNSPRNSRASVNLRDTDRSTPTASLMAYALDSGTTAPASADAPISPSANSSSAAAPATGFSALAASAAEVSGPVPPMAAAVAMMIVIETMHANTAPEMASIRARG